MRKFLFLLICICFSRSGFAAISPKTLDTTLSGTIASRLIETSWTFTSPNDYAKGFITFCNGFSLTSTTQTYTVSMGITGECETEFSLNGNTLKLTKDLHLGTQVGIEGPGFIDLNGFTMYGKDQVIFRLGPVSIFSSTQAGGIQGIRETSKMQFLAGGSLRFGVASGVDRIGLKNFKVINATTANCIFTGVHFLDAVDFLVPDGGIFEHFGSPRLLETAVVRYIGQGGTVIGSHALELTGVSQVVIDKGCTYRYRGASGFDSGGGGAPFPAGSFPIFTSTSVNFGDKTKIVVDNGSFIIDSFEQDFHHLTLEVLGNSIIGSMNGGSMNFFNESQIRIFPGATLFVDDNMLLKLGAP